jgi:hypothetical protein
MAFVIHSSKKRNGWGAEFRYISRKTAIAKESGTADVGQLCNCSKQNGRITKK